MITQCNEDKADNSQDKWYEKVKSFMAFSIAAEELRYIYSTIQLALSFVDVSENFDAKEKLLNMVSMTIAS